MKKIALLVLLALTLVSCWVNQEIKNGNTEIQSSSVVKNTDTITISYTGTLADGTVFDSSAKHPWEELSFEVWAGKIIKWLENQVIGMKLGETKTINVAAKDAYGESAELLLTKEDFEAIEKWGLKKADMKVWINKIGELWEVEILRIENDKYYAKHPNELAWKDLIFEVTIDKITPFIKKEVVSVWDNIAVTYTGTLADGTVFDASSKHWGTPLEFTTWAGQMIPGFDAGVIGMKLGETKTLNIAAKDAYGEKTWSWTNELAWKDLIFEVKIESIK